MTLICGMPLTNRYAYARSSYLAVNVFNQSEHKYLILGDKCFPMCILDGRIEDLEYLLPYGSKIKENQN